VAWLGNALWLGRRQNAMAVEGQAAPATQGRRLRDQVR
jgi:hypothetical protein